MSGLKGSRGGFRLRQLRIVAMVASGQSVGATARRIGITQSAATQVIRAIESQLSAPIFLRTHQGLRPNDLGRLIAYRYENAMRHLQEALRALRPDLPDMLQTQLAERLKLQHIEAFLALVQRHATITSVAGQLQTSRAAIYRSLHELQDLVGIDLVATSHASTRMSAAGELAVGSFRLAVHEIVAITHDIAALRGEAIGEIRIATTVTGRARMVPEIIGQSIGTMPKVTYSVISGDTREIVQMLLAGEVDFGFTSSWDFDPEQLRVVELGSSQLHVVARRGHPLDGAPVLTITDLVAFPWISPTSKSQSRLRYSQMFGAVPSPMEIMETDATEIIIGILAQSDCLALMTSERITRLGEGAALQKLEYPVPGDPTRLQLVTRRNWSPTVAQTAFRQLAEQARSRDGTMTGPLPSTDRGMPEAAAIGLAPDL